MDNRRSSFTPRATCRTSEYYVSDINGQNEESSSSFNDAQKEVAFSDAERFTYKSVDNLEIEGWLMKPYGYQPGKVPGSPLYPVARTPRTAKAGSEFQASPAAVSCSSRTAWIERHERGIHQRQPRRLGWQGLHRPDEGRGLGSSSANVDSTKMGVSGGSYGGFMTA